MGYFRILLMPSVGGRICAPEFAHVATDLPEAIKVYAGLAADVLLRDRSQIKKAYGQLFLRVEKA
ncbi:MAG: hypothetical protein ACP5VC_17905 [Bryobacteraceae bacterium]